MTIAIQEKEYKVRQIHGGDLFSVVRILKKSKFKVDINLLKDLMTGVRNKEGATQADVLAAQETFGYDIIMKFIFGLEEAEQEFFEFVAGLLVHEDENDKKTSPDWETIRTLNLEELVKLFTAIKDSEVGLVKLFSNAVNLMK
ncbi:hypothetical protein P4U03_30235 [Bacillus mycoides]|uniref:Phage related protein n=10 Tax=root TaxID=1 RepID=I7IDI4_9CAUD|nr:MULTISPECIES: hypothetical protein [Bacteria]YP_006560703.1 phage related protein [Staphylococcus phage SpaA1]YP_009099323.1 hypothetical protein Waukesha92_58 [Bacillus phage Waukesha92]YP_009218146.1 hypothetical protein XO28_0013 [Bacillus phage phi4J1]YP_009829826.1 phage related protein [Bacillus phage BceA1]ALO79913.1 hypothetical protein XO29_0013 [Bacillus phage phiS58]QCW20856.1 hypothetical protein WG69_0013 [Bacillus phage vB_BthS-TP21T]AID50247.1 hypothetical protein Waukesha9